MESRVHVWFCRCSEAIWRRPLNCLTKQSHWPTLNLKWWGLNTPHLWLNSCSRHDVINIPSWYELESKYILVLRGISLVWGMQPWLKSQSLPSWASPCPPWAWWARLWSELWSQVMLNLVHGPHRITTMPCSSKCGLDAQDYICEAPIVLRGPELALVLDPIYAAFWPSPVYQTLVGLWLQINHVLGLCPASPIYWQPVSSKTFISDLNSDRLS